VLRPSPRQEVDVNSADSPSCNQRHLRKSERTAPHRASHSPPAVAAALALARPVFGFKEHLAKFAAFVSVRTGASAVVCSRGIRHWLRFSVEPADLRWRRIQISVRHRHGQPSTPDGRSARTRCGVECQGKFHNEAPLDLISSACAVNDEELKATWKTRPRAMQRERNSGVVMTCHVMRGRPKSDHRSSATNGKG